MYPAWVEGCLWIDEVDAKDGVVRFGVCKVGFEMWERRAPLSRIHIPWGSVELDMFVEV